MARQQASGRLSGAGQERLQAQLAQSSSEIASALATANALARKLQAEAVAAAGVSSSSSGGRAALLSSNPSSAEMPAALGGAMQELSRLVSELLLATRRSRQQQPAAPHQAGSGSGLGPALLHPNISLTGAGAQSTGDQAGLQYAQLAQDHSRLQQQLAALQQQQQDRQQREGGQQGEGGGGLGGHVRAAGAMRGAAAALGSESDAGAAEAGVAATERLLELLRGSVRAVDGAAKRMEAAVMQQQGGQGQELRASASTLVSEVMATEAALAMLSASLARGGLGSAGWPNAPLAGYSCSDGNGGTNSTQQQASSRGAGRAAAKLAQFSFPTQEDMATPGGEGTVFSGAGHWLAATPAKVPGPDDVHPRQAGVQTGSGGDGGGTAAAMAGGAATVLAEKLLDMRQRADKWKARCGSLGDQLAAVGGSLAAREAAGEARVEALERQMEEQAARSQAEVLRYGGMEVWRSSGMRGGGSILSMPSSCACPPPHPPSSCASPPPHTHPLPMHLRTIRRFRPPSALPCIPAICIPSSSVCPHPVLPHRLQAALSALLCHVHPQHALTLCTPPPTHGLQAPSGPLRRPGCPQGDGAVADCLQRLGGRCRG